MEPQSLLTHSKTLPLCVGSSGFGKLSFRHFNKHLRFTPIDYPIRCSIQNPLPIRTHSSRSFSENPVSKSSKTTRIALFPPPSSTALDAASPEPETPFPKPLKNLSFHSLKAILSKITPYDVVKWSAVSSIGIAAAKWTANGLFNPFFWTYFSWTWVFWPWIVAVAVAGYGIYCQRKHSRGAASLFEQLAVVTSAFAWLTLVPPAHFNGFLQGWPYVFFFVYHYFFFFNVTVRKRLYGDFNLRPHDPKWDSTVPEWKTYLFSGGVFAGHWLAALEGPELHRISGGLFVNTAMWALIVATLLMQYNSTLYLANYSEKVVVPTAVVQFGPYRWVRHPIYASTMLLFATYCAALRSPFSMIFIVGVCVWYYDQKARLEEALMIESFGDGYVEYADRVKYKFIPFVF